MRVGTHDQQITGEIVGRCQQPCADHVVDGGKCGLIYRDVMRSELLGTQHRALTRALTGAGDSVIGVVLRTTAITRC